MEQHRSSNIIRETKETSVDLTIDLDGKGRTFFIVVIPNLSERDSF